jgi:hypothetical protein
MSLPGADAKLIAKRRQLNGAWRYVGSLLTVVVASFALYLWFRVPLLGNPFETALRLEAGGVPDTTLLLPAVMLPLVITMLFALVATLVAVVYRAFAHERRHIAIIDKLQRLERRRMTDA